MLEKWQRSISEADKRILSCLLTSFVQAYFLFRVVAHPTLAAPQLDRVLTLRYRPRFDQIWLPYQRLPEDRDQHGQS